MGKDLKGKELGQGISQRSDGTYTGRFTNSNGKRVQKYFKTLKECRNWLTNAIYEDKHGIVSDDITFKEWSAVWIREREKSIKPRTLLSYSRTVEIFDGFIGNMKMKDIRATHVQNAFIDLSTSRTKSSLGKYKGILHDIFQSAVDNDIIVKNPINRMVNANVGKEVDEKKPMTIEQQELFVDVIQDDVYELHYRFVLETGLRQGELSGLKWSDIDFESRRMHIHNNLQLINGKYMNGTTKSKSSNRIIPLSSNAISILHEHKKRMSGCIVSMEWAGYVFVSRLGRPVSNGTYNLHLRKFRECIGMNSLAMHTLRHTFATRCAESNMQPKVLQSIMGHSTIEMTMNIYVHATEDKKLEEMDRVFVV